MSRPASSWSVGVLVCFALFAQPSMAAQTSDSSPYQVVKLAEGVHGFKWTGPPIIPEPNVALPKDVVAVSPGQG